MTEFNLGLQKTFPGKKHTAGCVRFPEKFGPKTTPFTSESRIRFAGLFKNCPATLPDFCKKVDQRYRTFLKKPDGGIELSGKSPAKLLAFF